MLKLASTTSPENRVFAGLLISFSRKMANRSYGGSYQASSLHIYQKASSVCTTSVGGLVHTLVAFGSLCHAEVGQRHKSGKLGVRR